MASNSSPPISIKRAPIVGSTEDLLLTALFHTIAEGIIITDIEGAPVRWNQAAERLLGMHVLTAANWIERNGVTTPHHAKTLPGRERPIMRAIRGELVDGAELSVEHPLLRVPITLSISARPYRNSRGDTVGAVAVFREVSREREIEAQIKRSERLYRTMARHLPEVALLLFDDDLRFILADGSALRATGTKSDMLEGKRLEEAASPERFALLEPLYRAALQGEPSDLEINVQGETALRTHRMQIVPVRDEVGKIFAGMVVTQDITDRRATERALRQSEELHRTVVNVLSEGILVFRADGAIETCNTRAEQILGVPAGHLCGRKLDEIGGALFTQQGDAFPLAEHPAMVTLRSRLSTRGVVMRLLRGDGVDTWLSVSAEPLVQTGKHSEDRAVVSLVDVTALHHAAHELSLQTTELRRSNAELEQFAYVASHDLQEPLRMISSYTQLLARKYKGKLDEKADQYIAYAVDGATRMQRLIEDVLAYSRAGNQKNPFTLLDASACAAGIRATLRLRLEEADADLDIDPLPTIMGNATELEQLFQNLVGNALKFRAAGRRCRVHVSARRDGDTWIFSVHDNGIGIEPQYYDRIFFVFQRLHSRRQFEGTGIGLAICKKIVERHGGRIWVESVPGEGTAFLFTLPYVSHAKAALEGQRSLAP